MSDGLIAGFERCTFCTWAGQNLKVDPESLLDYLVRFKNPASLHGTCEDYRARWGANRAADEADRRTRKITAPTLVLWGEQYGVAQSRTLETWQDWARNVGRHAVSAGHFLVEEAPDAVVRAFREFFV